jgi:hypothetical protein
MNIQSTEVSIPLPTAFKVADKRLLSTMIRIVRFEVTFCDKALLTSLVWTYEFLFPGVDSKVYVEVTSYFEFLLA